jgi:hypothetical protein
MKKLGRWRSKKIEKLGNGATVYEEGSHFVHALGNKLTILRLRTEISGVARSERLAGAVKAKNKRAAHAATARNKRIAKAAKAQFRALILEGAELGGFLPWPWQARW